MTTHPNYELFEEIGRTETTIVYRAHDLALGRDVAIKELTDAGKADPRRQERLMREAQDLAQTEHPGILRIHTVVPENGWIVMELMQGSLSNQIRHSPMDTDTVRSILTQLLSALDLLHRQGKLHGAIRPSNVLIDTKGAVRLSDFEKVDLDGELRPPTSTKKYLAPEWIRSELGSLGPASDLYCLAFMAFELLAGPRFDALILESQAASADPEVAWLRKHSSNDPLPLVSMVLPETPADLAQTLDAMLPKRVEDRIASAAEALHQLSDQPMMTVQPIADATVRAPEPPGIMPAQIRQINPLSLGEKSSQGRPLTSSKNATSGKSSATLPATVANGTIQQKINRAIEKPAVLYPLCALILLFALGLGFYLRRDQVDTPDVLASTGQAEQPLANPDDASEVIDAAKDINVKATELDSSPDVAPEQKLAEVISLPPDLPRQSETASESDLTTETTVEMSTKPEMPTRPDVPAEPEMPAKTEELLAVAEPNVTAPLSSQSIPEEPTTAEPSMPVPPPDDFMKLVSQEIELDTSELLEQFKGTPEIVIDASGFLSEVSDVAIDPRGRWVAASGEKVVRLWDLSSGDLVKTLRGDRSRTSYGDCHTIAFSPDGEFLVVGVGDYQPHGSIRVYRTAALDQIDALLAGHNAPVRQLNFSRDGTLMTSADADGNVAVWDWPGRKIIKKIPPDDPATPIIDELLFASAESILLGIDYRGPFLLETGSLRRMTAADNLPPKLYGWMFDLLQRQLNFPYGTTDDPRVIDLKLDQDVWAAAGVGSQDGGNRFWVGVWSARDQDAPSVSDPNVIYSGHQWKIRSIDLLPSLGLAASADMFGEVHVWGINDAKPLHRFRAEGKPVYEASFDRNSSRIAFGSKSHAPDIWGRNNYGSIDRVLDLAARSIYVADASVGLDPIQEQPFNGSESLTVKRFNQNAGLSLVKQDEGREVSRYELTSGRNPTVFSFLEKPALGLNRPVVLGDSEGLLAVWDSDSDELKRAFIGHDAMVTAISVATDGRTLLSGSSDRTIRLWSLENPVPTGIFDFKFENTTVTRVTPGSSSARAGVQVGDQIESIDGKSMKEMYERMLTGEFNYRPGQVVPVRMSREGGSFVFEMQMNHGYDFSEPILSIYIGNENHWIVWTPQGYYDASPGSESLIGWHINRGPEKAAAYFPVGQFREQLYRPDIIDRLINGQSTEDAVLEANRERDESAEFDFRSPSDLAIHYPPVIEILSPLNDESLIDGQAIVEAVITSANGLPIREVTLLVDGTPMQSFRPRSPLETELKISHPLVLSNGKHRIELIALNAQSRGSESIAVNVSETGNPTKLEPATASLVVLAIGVTHGQSTSNSDTAGSSHTDAAAFAETMRGQAPTKLFRQVLTRVVHGDQATRSTILDGFQWLVDQVAPGDTVAIYLSADVFIDSSENYYIGTHDVDRDRPRATAVSWREFIKTIQTDLPSCPRIVFLELQPDEQSLAPGLRNPLLDLAAPELGTIVFSSTALQQRLPKLADDQHGYLNTALTKTLRDAATDVSPDPPDGLLSYQETSMAWIERVQQLSRGKLYPVSFAPHASRQINIFQRISENGANGADPM